MNGLGSLANRIKPIVGSFRLAMVEFRSAVRPAGAARATSFANSIAGRWQAQGGGAPFANLVWQETKPVNLLHTHAYRTENNLAPHLSLTIVNPGRQAGEFEDRLRRVVMVERIAAGKADGIGDLNRRRSGPYPVEAEAFRPVPRIVHQPAVVDTAVHQEAAGKQPPTGLPPRAIKQAQPSPMPSTHPTDVNHLVDQVIDTIDRRIIAQRERLGSI